MPRTERTAAALSGNSLLEVEDEGAGPEVLWRHALADCPGDLEVAEAGSLPDDPELLAAARRLEETTWGRGPGPP